MHRTFLALVFLSYALVAGAQSPAPILGVWRLEEFFSTQNGTRIDFCQGAHGLLSYIEGYMSVAINCEGVSRGTTAEKLGGILFYSGEMELQGDTVTHRVRHFSHPSLKGVVKRKVFMTDQNHLTLKGDLSTGESVVVRFSRVEKGTAMRGALPGLYKLDDTENQVEGIPHPVPFCQGYDGTILFTGGNHVSVSINCGEPPTDGSFEPAAQFGRRYFYSGTYEVLGGKLIVLPSNVSEVSQIGKPVERNMTIEGEYLILTGVNGSAFVAKWKKLKFPYTR